MKKLKNLVIIYIAILVAGATFLQLFGSAQAESNGEKEDNPVVIPDEAIRLRILANSDNKEDQTVKRYIRDRVNAQITEWVKDITDINEARKQIEDRLPEIKKVVGQALEDKDLSSSYDVKYGSNVKFPTKIYGNYIYPAGEYEAILITLGDGKGANWWCVLFPPLCFLDFSNGDAVDGSAGTREEVGQVQKEDVEVKFFVVELFQKLIGML
jgi:stage II sporulation protein R